MSAMSAVQRVAQANTAPPVAGTPVQTGSDYLSAIAAYIPSEAIGAYVGLTAITTKAGANWTFFAVGLAINILLTLTNYKPKAIKVGAPTTLPAGKLALAALSTTIAYLAYVIALPQSPFGNSIPNYVGFAAAGFLAIALPKLSVWLNFGPAKS